MRAHDGVCLEYISINTTQRHLQSSHGVYCGSLDDRTLPARHPTCETTQSISFLVFLEWDR